MNKLSNRRLARGFVAQLNDGKPAKALIEQLAAVIVETKRVPQVELITSDIAGELEKQMSVTNATVYSAHKLSAAIKIEVAKLIKGVSGSKKVEIIEELEPSLLGGVRIEMPEREIDLSIKNKLKSMEAIK